MRSDCCFKNVFILYNSRIIASPRLFFLPSFILACVVRPSESSENMSARVIEAQPFHLDWLTWCRNAEVVTPKKW